MVVFFYGEIGIEAELSRHISHAAADDLGLSNHVEAVDRGRALVWQKQCGQDAEQGRLARPVRPDEGAERALRNGEREMVQGADLSVAFGKPCHFDGVHSFSSPYRPIFKSPSLCTKTLMA